MEENMSVTSLGFCGGLSPFMGARWLQIFGWKMMRALPPGGINIIDVTGCSVIQIRDCYGHIYKHLLSLGVDAAELSLILYVPWIGILLGCEISGTAIFYR